MFKKAKLFSLLAVIVASTVVGLFMAPETAFAQDPGCESADGNVITFIGTNNGSSNGYHSNLCYKGNNYSWHGSTASLIKGQSADSREAEGSGGVTWSLD